MTGGMRCPSCGSTDVDCIPTPHAHVCHACGKRDQYEAPKAKRTRRTRHADDCANEVCRCGEPRVPHVHSEPFHAFVPMGPCDCQQFEQAAGR